MLSACAVVPDGAERYIDDREALFETVPEEHRKPGAYSVRVQFSLGKSLFV